MTKEYHIHWNTFFDIIKWSCKYMTEYHKRVSKYPHWQKNGTVCLGCTLWRGEGPFCLPLSCLSLTSCAESQAWQLEWIVTVGWGSEYRPTGVEWEQMDQCETFGLHLAARWRGCFLTVRAHKVTTLEKMCRWAK